MDETGFISTGTILLSYEPEPMSGVIGNENGGTDSEPPVGSDSSGSCSAIIAMENNISVSPRARMTGKNKNSEEI